MKLSKRLVAVLLLAGLLFSLSACSGSGENVFGVSSPTTPLENAVSDGSTLSDSETPVAYRNDYFGFTCTLPNDWYVLNSDEIKQVIGNTKDALGEGDASDIIKKSLDDGTSTMDFYAVAGSGTQTINIVLGKGKLLERFLSEQQLMQASVSLLTSALENMGATDVTHSAEKITVLGEEHSGLLVQANYQGVTIDETIFMIRKGSYLSTITITDLTGNPATEVLGYIQTID